MQRGCKKRLSLCGNFRHKFTLSITFKATDSPEKFSFKTHPRYYTFVYCSISALLYTMFKALAFLSLSLVPNKINFVLSWPKCLLNLSSTKQSKV